MLKKGLALCHGIMGGVYAFLALYRVTGDPQPLYRAQRFAQYLFVPAFMDAIGGMEDRQRYVQGQPDHPFSLMEGASGTVCALADLLAPADSAFPGFDFD